MQATAGDLASLEETTELETSLSSVRADDVDPDGSAASVPILSGLGAEVAPTRRADGADKCV